MELGFLLTLESLHIKIFEISGTYNTFSFVHTKADKTLLLLKMSLDWNFVQINNFVQIVPETIFWKIL